MSKNNKHSSLEGSSALISKWLKAPEQLFLKGDSKTKLQDLMHKVFQEMNTREGKEKKVVFGNFELEQVWSQMIYHTESANKRNLQKLERIIEDEGFQEELERLTEQKDKMGAEPEAEEDEEDID